MKDSAEQSRQQQIKALFEAALDRAPDGRELFLQHQTAGDAVLLAAVQELLQAHAQAAGFLETPLQFAAPSVPAEAAAGQRIGPYRLLREIGRGGMATVYLAERDDDEFQQLVAVKLLWPRADSAEVVRRFRQERQILAQLNHPNIARLLDGGTTEQGWPYLVMEYIEGQPLTRYCAALQLSIPARLQLFQTVCGAVAYAHQNLVIHRDLKPSNILVTADGTIKLLDFGIAKMLTPETSDEARTRTGLQWLTPEYASPEQVREEAITTASDVYSLGVLLYELLSGVRPHELQEMPLHEIIRVLGEDDPPPPSRRVTPAHAANCAEASAEKLQRRLRGDLDNIALLALSKAAPPRYRTVEELSEDLRRHLNGEPVRARPATLAYRFSKFVKRHPATAVFVLLLCFGLLAALWQLREARLRAREQRRELYAARILKAGQDWFDGNVRGYQAALQSPPVQPQNGEEDLRGLEWRYLWRLGHRERLTLGPLAGCEIAAPEPGYGFMTRCDNNRRLTFWDARTGQPQVEHQFPAPLLITGALMLNGKWNLTYHTDGHTLMALELLSGTQTKLLSEQSNPITCAWEQDEKWYLTGHADGQVKRWDRRTGQAQGVLFTAAGPLRALYPNASRERLVTLTGNNVAQLWDMQRARLLLRLEGVTGLVTGPGANHWLIANFGNNSLGVYDLGSARKLNTLETAGNPIVFAQSLASNHLLISQQDNAVRLYELPGLRLAGTFTGHSEWVNAAWLFQDGKWLATASSDRTVKLWDVAAQRELATLKGHPDDVVSVAGFDQERQLMTVSQDKTLKFWDVAEVLRPETLTGHTGHIFSVAFAPDGRTLASASQDRSIKLWDVATGALRKTLRGHAGQIFCVNFSPDGQRLVSSGEGQAARVWDVATGQLLFELCCHRYQMHAAAFAPDGQVIATASDDRTVKLWDAANGCELRTLTGHTRDIWSLAFTPDGRTLASGTDQGEVRFWEVASGRQLAAWQAHAGSIWSIAFTPDGQQFATASGDQTARLWQTATRRLVREFKGHTDSLFELAFTLDGQRLVTASRDKTVRFWNVATGQELLILKGHTDQVWSVAFAPDGNTLASGSWDKTVRLWRAASEPVGQTKSPALNSAKK